MTTVGKKSVKSDNTQFWLLWVAAYAIPAALIFPLAYLAIYSTAFWQRHLRTGPTLSLVLIVKTLGPSFIFLTYSVLAGVLQLLVLRRRVPNLSRFWLYASSFGYFMGFLVAAFWFGGLDISLPEILFVAGTSAGVAQAWVLRYYVKRLGWWIAANLISTGVFVAIYLPVGEVLRNSLWPLKRSLIEIESFDGQGAIFTTVIIGVAVGLLAGTGQGLVNGVVLARLLKRPVLAEDATLVSGE